MIETILCLSILDLFFESRAGHCKQESPTMGVRLTCSWLSLREINSHALSVSTVPEELSEDAGMSLLCLWSRSGSDEEAAAANPWKGVPGERDRQGSVQSLWIILLESEVCHPHDMSPHPCILSTASFCSCLVEAWWHGRQSLKDRKDGTGSPLWLCLPDLISFFLESYFYWWLWNLFI